MPGDSRRRVRGLPTLEQVGQDCFVQRGGLADGLLVDARAVAQARSTEPAAWVSSGMRSGQQAQLAVPAKLNEPTLFDFADAS